MRDKIDDVHKAIEREKARREFADGNVKQLIKKYGGNAYTNAFECLLTMMTVNEHSKQAFREKAKLLKVALVGQEPSAIVSMMVQRVILGWLDVHYADALFYVSSHDSDLARVDYLDRRRHRAARRLNQAVKCLADVQRTTTEVVHNRISRFDLIRASIN